jgi:glycosyl transferase family 87
MSGDADAVAKDAAGPSLVDEEASGRFQVWFVGIVAAAAGAFALKVLLALTTEGTEDLATWQWLLKASKEFEGAEVYRRIEVLFLPPLTLHILRLVDALATSSGLPFAFWFRLLGVLADLGSIILVWKTLGPRPGETSKLAAVWLVAAAPTSIMVSGFHGNFDPILIFFLLLSIYLLDRRGLVWLGGVAFGMSVAIKAWPMIFAPALFFWLPDWRSRGRFFAGAGMAVVGGWLPYVVQDPVLIIRRMLSYTSHVNWWGITRLTRKLPGRLRWMKHFYDRYGRFVVLGAVGGASLWLRRLKPTPPLFMQCGFLAFLFMALTPGFGVQYLVWLVPWVAGLGLRATAVYHVTSGVFLFLVYTYWSGGFPWHSAQSRNWGWHHPIVIFELACWIGVVGIAWAYFKALSRPSRATAYPA